MVGGNRTDRIAAHFVTEWLAGRSDRKEKAAERAATRKPAQRDPRTAQRRAERITAGVDELDQPDVPDRRLGFAAFGACDVWFHDTQPSRGVAPGR